MFREIAEEKVSKLNLPQTVRQVRLFPLRHIVIVIQTEIRGVNIVTYIKFANQTYAQKALSVLKNYGISARLKRNPNPNRKEGCNFALFVSGDIKEAFEIISQNGIPNFGTESFGDYL